MPSSRYKRPRHTQSEPPPELPDLELTYRLPASVVDTSTRAVVLGLNEVMSEVFSYLCGNDVFSCLLVSKKFKNVAFPHLYRHIVIKPCTKRHTEETRPTIPEKFLKCYTKSIELFPHWYGHYPHNTYSYPHAKDWLCGMPRIGEVHVGTVFINNKGKCTYIDETRNPIASGAFHCPKCKDNIITADRCVVRPPNLALIHTLGWAPSSTTLTFFVPQATGASETTVLLRHMFPTIGWKTGHREDAHNASQASPHPSPVAEPTKKLTFIFLPQYWDHGFVYDNVDFPKFSEPLRIKQMLTSLIYRLGDRAAMQPDHSITIVGLEDCNPFARPDYWKFNHEREAEWPRTLRDQFKSRMSFWSESQQTVRMSTVHVVSFEDYLNSNEWHPDDLCPLLVKRWLKMLDFRRLIDAARGSQKKDIAKVSGMWYQYKKSQAEKKRTEARLEAKREQEEQTKREQVEQAKEEKLRGDEEAAGKQPEEDGTPKKKSGKGRKRTPKKGTKRPSRKAAKANDDSE